MCCGCAWWRPLLGPVACTRLWRCAPAWWSGGGPASGVAFGSLCPQLVVDWGSGWHLRARALAPIWVLNRMWYALLASMRWWHRLDWVVSFRSSRVPPSPCCGMGELPNRCGSIQLIQPVVGIAGTHRSQRALGVLGAPFCIGPAQLDVLMHLARHSSILCRCKGWSGPWCPFDLYPAGWQYASVLCYPV